MALPTVSALDVLVKWANEGPGSLVTEPTGVPRNRQASRQMVHLRRLVTTLQVSRELADEVLVRQQYRDFGNLSVELLSELARLARLGGYVSAGCRQRVPLTPVQATTLGGLSWGATYTELSRRDGGRISALTEGMGQARTDNGCATTVHLVATAFRNGWLPDRAELSVLLSGHMVWSMPVPHYGPMDKPPYLWKDHG